MIFRSYFPDSKGKYGIDRNNEPCFFITVFRPPFHENVYSKYWYNQSYFDNAKMTWPNQVQILVNKITRSIVNFMYVKVTHFLYPKMVSSIFLQVRDTLTVNSLDGLVIQTLPTLHHNYLCMFLFCVSQGVLLTLTQSWQPVHLTKKNEQVFFLKSNENHN